MERIPAMTIAAIKFVDEEYKGMSGKDKKDAVVQRVVKTILVIAGDSVDELVCTMIVSRLVDELFDVHRNGGLDIAKKHKDVVLSICCGGVVEKEKERKERKEISR